MNIHIEIDFLIINGEKTISVCVCVEIVMRIECCQVSALNLLISNHKQSHIRDM